MYLHHLPQLLAQVGLEAGALHSQAYHIIASIAVSLPVKLSDDGVTGNAHAIGFTATLPPLPQMHVSVFQP